VPRFVTRSIHQSSPFAGYNNTISATLEATVQLAGADGAWLMLSRLNFGGQGRESGLDVGDGNNSASTFVSLFGDSANSFCLPLAPGIGLKSGAAGWAMYSASKKVVHLYVCSDKVLDARRPFVISFALTNPLQSQSSSDIVVNAGAEADRSSVAHFSIPFSRLENQGQALHGVVNATDPVRVIRSTFHFATISQSNFYATELNTLSVYFTTSVSLACEAADVCHSITVRGLFGGEVRSSFVALIGDETVLERLCRSSLGDGRGTGAWDAGAHRLTVWVCPNKTIEAWEHITFKFTVMNAAAAQGAPEIVMAAAGPVPFEEVIVSKPGVDFLGVAGGTDPLKIVAPQFSVRNVGQTMPFAGVPNLIVLTLQVCRTRSSRLFIPYPTPSTLHPTPYTLHPTPYTLHPTPNTLHPTPYTLHPTP